MRRKRRASRKGRGALFVLGALFAASGLIRLVDGTGLALAREFDLLPSATAETEAQAAGTCESDVDLAEALVAMRVRSDELDAQQQQVEERLALLGDAEERIRAQLAALQEAERALARTVAIADGAAEEDIGRLVQVYEQMKPKDAAALFEAMDPTFAAGFLARIRPDAAASIMAGLSPAKAYTISAVLAGRNSGAPRD